MTIQEIHDDFLHFYDKQSNFSAPEINTVEIDIYLNDGQNTLLELVSIEGLEKKQEFLDYFKNITIPFTTNSFTTDINLNKPNSKYVTLPSNYRTSLLEEATVTYTNCNNVTVSKRILVTPITRDEYSKAIGNPFRKPWKEEILRLMTNGKIELISADNITITNYYLDYIKEPNLMDYENNITCELDYKAIQKIIELAVKKALKTIGDQRISIEQMDDKIKTLN
jgi:hypothetical protein